VRKILAIAAFAPLLFAAASCGDDGGDGGTDDEAACQAACEATYADDLEGCDVCGVDVVFADGACDCYFLSCVSDLCDAWCEEADAGVSGTCYLDSCTCP
jgi:hypothetical protein